MSGILRWATALLTVALIAAQWQARNERREVQRLRERVVEARAEADGCTRDLAVAEEDFRQLDRRVDSLRSAVATLEALDARGVPARRYEEYLDLVEAYNAGVEDWQAAADDLRTAEQACRARVDRRFRSQDGARSAAETVLPP